MAEIDAILLAAGLSRRMGARNKLLADIFGKPMIRHVAETYLAVVDGPVSVVTGHERERIEAALDGLAVRFVHNRDYAAGQQSSVAAGLAAGSNAAATLIGLGDQPALRPADLAALIAAHAGGDPGKITIPHDGTRRGNPIAVPAVLRPRLTDNPDRPGCMRFTREHPDLVQWPRLDAVGFYLDVDTPEALAAFRHTRERSAS